jgi:hypothetical protein
MERVHRYLALSTGYIEAVFRPPVPEWPARPASVDDERYRDETPVIDAEIVD